MIDYSELNLNTQMPGFQATPEADAEMIDAAKSSPLLILTVGLPGAGKTSWARNLQARLPVGSIVRVSRDDLRSMLVSGDWPYGTPQAAKLETVVTTAATAAMYGAFTNGVRIVVCDNTNLDPGLRHALTAAMARIGVITRIRDFRHVPLDWCLANNATRPSQRRVPSARIREMYARWIEPIAADIQG